MSKLLSVIMPVYNAERYLAEAVESILGQTYSDFEFLIVDDGSTDGSLAILEKYAALDQRICLRTRPNTGYVVALNEMLGDARGKFIARMDADDIALPMRFERQVEVLTANRRCVAVGSRVNIIDCDGDDISRWDLPLDHAVIDAAHMNNQGPLLVHPSSMIRADAINAVGKYRVNCCPSEDYDLWLRLAEVGELANLSEVLLEYRRHAPSVSHVNGDAAILGREIALRDAFSRRNIADVAPSMSAVDLENIDHHRQWAWMALKHGNRGAARKHAMRAIRRDPLNLAVWKLMACVVRGY